jgi:hypothetical protein
MYPVRVSGIESVYRQKERGVETWGINVELGGNVARDMAALVEATNIHAAKLERSAA